MTPKTFIRVILYRTSESWTSTSCTGVTRDLTEGSDISLDVKSSLDASVTGCKEESQDVEIKIINVLTLIYSGVWWLKADCSTRTAVTGLQYPDRSQRLTSQYGAQETFGPQLEALQGRGGRRPASKTQRFWVQRFPPLQKIPTTQPTSLPCRPITRQHGWLWVGHTTYSVPADLRQRGQTLSQL